MIIILLLKYPLGRGDRFVEPSTTKGKEGFIVFKMTLRLSKLLWTAESQVIDVSYIYINFWMIAVDCCVKSQGPRWQWYAMMPPFFTLTGGTLIFILYLYVVWVKTEAWWHTDLGHFDIFNFSTMQGFLVATFWPIAACTPKLVCRDCHTEPIKSVGSSTPSNHAPSLQCWNLHATWGEANVRLYTTTQCPQCPQCWSNHSDSPGLIIRNWSVTLGHPG